MAYTNSPLVSYTKLSPNHSGKRKYEINRISPHCVVGQLSVETLGNVFAPTSRQASCQYGIGSDGRVGMYVEEKNRSWCTSDGDNDNRAVTIECASDSTAPYAFKPIVYNKLIDLCVDICKRNNKNKLIWIEDKNKALSYQLKPNEMLLTVHRWFAKKSCPGDWMFARMGDLASKVNAKLGSNNNNPQSVDKPVEKEKQETKPKTDSKFPYIVSITANSLNIRMEPNANSIKHGYVTKNQKFTIVEEATDKTGKTWGKLKSGAGWICLKYTKEV